MSAARAGPDPVQVEVWRHLLESIAGEMGLTLERTGFSPNIKERRDYSCALFDAEGRLLAQAAHIPVHLGAMPLMMQRLRPAVAWPRGVMWLCNAPEWGGTHLPDLTLVAPVWHRGALRGFVANRAHHADVGGITPGSMARGTELLHEGIVLPPLRLVTVGRVQEEVMALVCANSRTPDERRGDLSAQVAACRVGQRRFGELLDRHGPAELDRRAAEAREAAERLVRAALREGAPGQYTFEDALDEDGAGGPGPTIRVRAVLADGGLLLDFSGTSPQAPGCINATAAVTLSACCYVLRCLAPADAPTNAGTTAPLTVHAPTGTVVNADVGCAVAAGNVETSQRIVDVVLGALAPAFPKRIPAASQGTMNNLAIGGPLPGRRSFAYYETICGGAGAGPTGDGASAVHTHMTNTLNTPVEALELHYPLRVRRCALRDGSGGAGEHRGGDGVVRSVELLAAAHVSLVTERRRRAPYGAAGGGSGSPGRNTVQAAGELPRDVGGTWSGDLPAGSVVTVATPGGGGWGRQGDAAAPEQRDP